MYTQFFGNFLLNNNYTDTISLSKALQAQSNTKLKLGVLAINSGYMTAEQVEKVHNMQQKVDKRFGDLAVKMGYLNDEKVTELLTKQQPGYLLLGQTLFDNGDISPADLEKAITEYKEKYSIIDSDLTIEQNDRYKELINDFYRVCENDSMGIEKDYISLLFNNLIRFIGTDFIPREAKVLDSYSADNAFIQEIDGAFDAQTAITVSHDVTMKFACRYAGEETTDVEYAMATVSEFLNLQNGLFAVNLSNSNNIEISLQPQKIISNFKISDKPRVICIPFEFSFGTVNFIFAKN